MSIRLHYTVKVYLINSDRPACQYMGFFDNAALAIVDALFHLSTVEKQYVSKIEVSTKEVKVQK